MGIRYDYPTSEIVEYHKKAVITITGNIGFQYTAGNWANMIDEDNTTFFELGGTACNVAAPGTFGYINFDFGAVITFDRMYMLYGCYEQGGCHLVLKIETSVDGVTWVTQEGRTCPSGTTTYDWNDAGITCRYLRLNINKTGDTSDDTWARIYEFIAVTVD